MKSGNVACGGTRWTNHRWRIMTPYLLFISIISIGVSCSQTIGMEKGLTLPNGMILQDEDAQRLKVFEARYFTDSAVSTVSRSISEPYDLSIDEIETIELALVEEFGEVNRPGFAGVFIM